MDYDDLPNPYTANDEVLARIGTLQKHIDFIHGEIEQSERVLAQKQDRLTDAVRLHGEWLTAARTLGLLPEPVAHVG